MPTSAPNVAGALGAAAAASGAGPSGARQTAGEQGAGFSGHGRTLGEQPSNSNPQGGSVNSRNGQHPETKVQALANMGVSREEAIRLLDAANGDV